MAARAKTVWYRCPQGHIFEEARKARHHFCKLCQKIYALLGRTGECRKMVKCKNVFADPLTEEGRRIISDYKAKVAKIKERFYSARGGNSAYMRRYHAARKAMDPNYSHSKPPKEMSMSERKAKQQYHKNYMKKYNRADKAKSAKADYQRIMDGLALLGLGTSRSKRYRMRLKCRAMSCPICSAVGLAPGESVATCTRCGYYKPMAKPVAPLITV